MIDQNKKPNAIEAMQTLEEQIRAVRRHLTNWIDAEWREYKDKKGRAIDFKNYLRAQVRKGMHNENF